jgi:nucleoside 2-deoxyribosyltransferase
VTYQATVVRILIASPGDTVNERRVLRETLEDWNSLNGDQGVFLQPLMWERDATPELGDRAQGVINRQLVDNADMLVGVFWTRLGTPTSEADSGTVEEIERIAAARKPVLLYFSKKPIVLESVDPEQYAFVRQAQERFMARGLVDQFESEDELRRKVSAAITRTVRARFASAEVADSLRGDESTARVYRAAGARLIASIDRFSQRPRFVVENRGEATAENVTIEVEAGDDGRKPTIFLPDTPIRNLPPGGAVDFAMAVTMGTSLVWDAVFRWSDTQGEHEARQTVTY